MKALRRLSQFLATEKLRLFLGLLLMGIATAASLIQPRLFGWVVDEGILSKNGVRIQQLTLILFLNESLRFLCTFSYLMIFAKIGQNLMQSMRLFVLSHYLSLPMQQFDRVPAGRMVTRLTNDISSISEMFSAGVATILLNLLVIVGIMVNLYMLSPSVGLAVLLLFPFIAWVTYLFSKHLRTSYGMVRDRLSRLNAILAESILGIKVLQLFNRISIQKSKVLEKSEEYMNAQIRSVTVFMYFQPVLTVLSGVAMAFAMVIGVKSVQEEQMPIGHLVSIFAYVIAVFQPLKELADKWNVFLSGFAACERVFAVFEWKTEFASQDIVRVPLPIHHEGQGKIEFRKVSLSYREGVRALNDVSFILAPGEHFGVVGATGAGKSSILSALLRFYEIDSGQILLDGVDIRNIAPRDLRSRLGLVQQEVFLFSGTVKQNIALGRTGIDWHAVEKQFEALDIQRLLGRNLHERATNLSMGEKQLISFLRAWVARPVAWLLDEATASLDAESELRMMQLLNQASSEQSAILIAHRLSTLKNVNSILVMQQGQLVESGSESELLKNLGHYSRLKTLDSQKAASMR